MTPSIWVAPDGTVFVLFGDNRGPYWQLAPDGATVHWFTLPADAVQVFGVRDEGAA